MRFILLFISLISIPAFSAWQLDNEKSKLSFVSIKKNTVAENHTFSQLSGEVDDNGLVNIIIDLTSVNTHIAKRDDRLKGHLFNTAIFPKAIFSAQLNMNEITKISTGTSKKLSITGLLDLHGHQQQVKFEILLVKLSDGGLVVASLQPIIVNAEAFGLVAGINKLQELAKLPSISAAIPVSFVATFK